MILIALQWPVVWIPSLYWCSSCSLLRTQSAPLDSSLNTGLASNWSPFYMDIMIYGEKEEGEGLFFDGWEKGYGTTLYYHVFNSCRRGLNRLAQKEWLEIETPHPLLSFSWIMYSIFLPVPSIIIVFLHSTFIDVSNHLIAADDEHALLFNVVIVIRDKWSLNMPARFPMR